MSVLVQDCPRCGYDAFVPLFTGSDRLYRTTDQEFRLVECTHCGLLQLFPRPSPEELSRYYPENYWWSPDASAVGWLEGIYRDLVLWDHVRFVWPGVKGRSPVLDVGCGGGSFLAALKKRGAEVMGLDSSEKAAEVAWQHHGIRVVNGLLPDVDIVPKTFGTVTMFHVLEHVANPEAQLRAAHRLLYENGMLYVQVPNASCWQFLMLGELWSGIDMPRHLIDFRAEDVVTLVENAGFQVLRKKFFSLRDNPAGLATSLFPQLEPMARRVRRVKESPRRA